MKIKWTLPIPKDKLQHLIVGFSLSLSFVIFSHIFDCRWIKHVGLALTLLVGYLKESTYDADHPEKHTRDFNDFSATALGAFFAHLW